MDVVAANASEGLAQHRVKWLNRSDAIQGALTELEEELSLPTAPRRMECYDISHIQGSNLVGSMVVFDDGKARTRDYRRFKIKAVDGVDDYASMKEMLTRRFKRLSQAIANPDPDGRVDNWGVVPDLVIIDGGKGSPVGGPGGDAPPGSGTDSVVLPGQGERGDIRPAHS